MEGDRDPNNILIIIIIILALELDTWIVSGQCHMATIIIIIIIITSLIKIGDIGW